MLESGETIIKSIIEHVKNSFLLLKEIESRVILSKFVMRVA